MHVSKILDTGKKWVGIGKKDAYKTEGEFEDIASVNATGGRLTLEKVCDSLADDEKATFRQLYDKAKAKYEETHKAEKIDKQIEKLQALMEKLQAQKSAL